MQQHLFGHKASTPHHTKSPADELEWTILELIAEHRRGLCDRDIAGYLQDPLSAKLKARAGLVRKDLVYWRGDTRCEGQMVWHATTRGRWMLDQL